MKFGVAHVAGLYNYPGVAGEQFTEGCQAIWDLGVRTLKIWCTSAFNARDYPRQTFTGAPTTAKEFMQTPEVDAEFDRGWDQIIFVIYAWANNPGATVTNGWRVNPSAEFMTVEMVEIQEAGEYVLERLDGTGTEVVFQNWEGDWALMDAEGAPDTRVSWQQVHNFAAWLGTRQRAVEAARRTVASDCTLLHAMEANLITDVRRFPHRPRVLGVISKLVQPDVISLSAYDPTIVNQGGWGANHSAWVAATTPVYTAALRTAKRACPHARLNVGEFGFPEGPEKPGSADVASMVQVIHDISLAESVHTLCYWQVFGNDETSPGSGIPRLFATHKPDGTLTAAGTKIAALAP